jgi:nucleoside-diphosphate kinase
MYLYIYIFIYKYVDIVAEFRAFSGPLSPELARTLRPDSLRSLFGSDTTQNAVHCTDLPEDGDMECRYIFETLFNIKV